MRKLIFNKRIICWFVFFMPILLSAQNVTMDFQNQDQYGACPSCEDCNTCSFGTAGRTINNVLIKATHGCPSFHYTTGLVMSPFFSNEDGRPLGKGLAIVYNFKANHTYVISLIYSSVTNTYLQAQLTNSPTFAPILCTYNNLAVDFTGTTNPFQTFTSSNMSVTFNPMQCYSHLWLSSVPIPTTQDQGVYIARIEIQETPNYVISAANNQNYICSGTRDYTVPNFPTGASISWSISDPNLATIPANSTSPTVTVTKVANSGVVTLTANITNCGVLTHVITKKIPLGVPSFIGTTYFSGTYPTISTFNSFSGTGAGHVLLDGEVGYNNYYWTLHSGTVASWTQSNMSTYGQRLDFNIGPNQSSGYMFSFNLYAYNSCGTLNETYYFYYTGLYGYRVASYPNPSKGQLTVSLEPDNDKSFNKPATGSKAPLIYKIKITDLGGNVRREFSYQKGIANPYVSVAGILPGNYMLSVFDGVKWNSKMIIVDK